MAEDDGTGRPVYGSSASGRKDLDVDADELKDFKDRVDKLLITLEGSPAAPAKMADGEIPKGDMGAGFGEATALYGIYKKVHQELQDLSTGLAGQIQALSIAVLASKKGYQNIDDDIKERMRRISQDAHNYNKRREQEKHEAEQPAKDERPKQDGGQGDTSGVHG